MPDTTVEFADLTPAEEALVHVIAKRAHREIGRRIIDTVMDLHAVMVHVPLDLKRLAEADRFNFMHDVRGILRYLNRETGELENCFMPRHTTTKQGKTNA